MSIDFTTPPFTQLAAYRELLMLEDERFIGDLNLRSDWPSFASSLDCNDDLHYEARVARGVVSTRPNSWHDRFGAIAWLEFPRIKRVLNELQIADLAQVGPKTRTRHQQALTHVDEAGLIVASRDPGWIDAMQDHQWRELLTDRRRQLGLDVEIWVLGHALFELKLTRSDELLAGKVLPVVVPRDFFELTAAQRRERLDVRVAQALVRRELGADPKDLSTLPLAALAGWHPHNAIEEFIRNAPCFRPKPPGRVYAPAIQLG